MATLQSFLWGLDARTVVLSACIFLAVYWLFGHRRGGLPPGPWGLPLVGAIPALAWGVHRGMEPHHLLQEYAKKYGSVFQLSVLNKTVVVLSDLSSVRDAFQHPNLNDRPSVFLSIAMKSDGVATASGESWIKLRRFSLTALKSLGVGKSSFEEKIGTEAEEVIKEMTKHDGKPFNPKSLLGNAVSNVICSVIFGKRYEYSDREFQGLLYLLSRNFKLLGSAGVVNFFPNLRHLPFVKTEELFANFHKIAEFISSIIAAHRADFDADNHRDFTDAYLNELQAEATTPAPDGGPDATLRGHLRESNFVGTVGNLFAAGTETTATTLEWCLLYMMAYPDVQQRVHAEIDAVVGRNRLPRLADKPELNFTQAVIWEVQRVAMVTPLGVTHSAASDTKFRGFLIPKGAYIVPNLWAISRDPKVWPEPDQFKPQRFLNEGKAVKPEEFIPFSIGRRSCIGEHLAKMELFIFFSHSMHQFTFKMPDNSRPLSLKGKGGITFSPLPHDICAVARD